MAKTYFWLGKVVCLFFFVSTAIAGDPMPTEELEQDLALAQRYMKSFKNDSANVVLTRMIDLLGAQDALDTPFGLKVRYHQAEALEKDHQDEVAVKKLLGLLVKTAEHELWEIQANIYLSLARLHEKIGQHKKCIGYLELARGLINQHQLNKIYPRFSIRYSSYHRLYGDIDSSRHYARETIEAARSLEMHEDEATGHLLMGMVMSAEDYKTAAAHFIKAGKRWEKIGDYHGYGAILDNLASLYLENNQPYKALAYNDSALVISNKFSEINPGSDNVSYVYKHRAYIYEQLGRLDSALFYLDKGYQLEQEELYRQNHARIIEVEEKYFDGQREQQLLEQAQQITYDRDRRLWLWTILILIVLSAIILGYYAWRLKKANHLTRSQAHTIAETNEDLSDALNNQIMLQGEVHHRVKNNLQVIISLLELQKEDMDDPAAKLSLDAMAGRIYSMAAIHEILYQSEGMGKVDFEEYAGKLCHHFKQLAPTDKKPNFNITVEPSQFNIETLMPLGIILNELLTNTLKYASHKKHETIIQIDLRHLEDSYCLTYRDNGPGFTKGSLERQESGLGTYLLTSMSRQLGGQLESTNDQGAIVRIYFNEKNNPQEHEDLQSTHSGR